MSAEMRHGDPRLLTNRERLERINELLKAETRYCEKIRAQDAEIARLRAALETVYCKACDERESEPLIYVVDDIAEACDKVLRPYFPDIAESVTPP